MNNLWEHITKKDNYFYGLFFAMAIIYILHIGFYPLFNPDEGRYSEIPREMLINKDFITPYLNDVLYFEKPALQYWMNAIFMLIFGENEFANRLFTALCGIGGIITTYILGKKIFNRETGILASIIIFSSMLYFIIASLNILDMAVAFFITLALCFYYFYYIGTKKIYLYLMYIAMAFGVLTKGLIGIVLVMGVILLFLGVNREFKKISSLISPVGIILFFLITTPWFYMVSVANPDFFHFFFIHEHFERYLTKVHARYEPFYFFIPCLLLGFIPWLGFFISIYKNIKNEFLKYKKGYTYLITWFFLIFIFFSISDSKLVPYIIPCFMPLAIIISRGILNNITISKSIILNSIINLSLAVLLFIFYLKFNKINIEFIYISPMILILAFFSLIFLFIRRIDLYKIISLQIVFAFLFTISICPLITGFAHYRSGKEVANYVNTIIKTDSTIIMYKDYLQDLPFYTKKRIMLSNYTGELAFGASHKEGEGWFINADNLKEKWEKESTILVFHNKNYAEIVDILKLNPTKIKTIGKYNIIENTQ